MEVQVGLVAGSFDHHLRGTRVRDIASDVVADFGRFVWFCFSALQWLIVDAFNRRRWALSDWAVKIRQRSE